MWDLVGNPEDRVSHNEAHMARAITGKLTSSQLNTVTRLCHNLFLNERQWLACSVENIMTNKELLMG